MSVPAEYVNGNRKWFLDNQLHREDGPAIERVDGSCEWFLNGLRHREDGPAIVNVDGSREFNRLREWFINGKRHREDGPAIEFANGDNEWFAYGKRHREDGPAVYWADRRSPEWRHFGVSGRREWWWRGKELEVGSQEEFEKLKPLLLVEDVQNG